MSDLEQQSAVGGNFAYDVGRVIRFVYIAVSEGTGPNLSGPGVPIAIGDWVAHSA
jgi:hypothetical protein